MKLGSRDPTEVRDVSIVLWDADIFLSLGKWSGRYDSDIVSTDDSEEETDNWQGRLLEGEEKIDLFVLIHTSWVFI